MIGVGNGRSGSESTRDGLQTCSAMMPANALRKITIADLLKPHLKSLIGGILAVIGAGIATLLEPWPLKIVVDNVLKSQPVRNGWLNKLIAAVAGTDKLAILKLAAISFLVISCVDAICTYVQKYITTSVGQWVMHDLRRAVYAHIQKLSLAYHDQAQTGDLLSRVTSDIDSVQSFIVSGLLEALINCFMLIGMIGVMLYLTFSLFRDGSSLTRRLKEAIPLRSSQRDELLQNSPSSFAPRPRAQSFWRCCRGHSAA